MAKHGVVLNRLMRVKIFDQDNTPIDDFETTVKQFLGCSSFHLVMVVENYDGDRSIAKEV